VALILPVAFINRIRATQEYPVFVCLLLAVYATQKSRTSPRWIPLLILAACGMVLVKGLFVVFVPLVCGLWLICVRDGERGDVWAWLGIVLSAPAVVLCALGYDYLHQVATGESFLNFYLPYRLGQVNATPRASNLIVDKLGNVGFYTARLLWFGFPGTLALLIAAPRWKRPGPRPASRREMQGLLFALATAAAYVAVMSLGNMRAERFILPAYFAIGIAGVFVAVHRWRGPSRLADRLTALPPYAPALAWLFLVLAALPFELYVPYVKFR
jgi:hypothetical protein